MTTGSAIAGPVVVRSELALDQVKKRNTHG